MGFESNAFNVCSVSWRGVTVILVGDQKTHERNVLSLNYCKEISDSSFLRPKELQPPKNGSTLARLSNWLHIK